jgi:hypothetical protein
VVHRRNEVGFLPAQANQASTSEASHARPDFAKASSGRPRMLLYCVATSAGHPRATLVRRQNLISKSHSRALSRRLNSRSPVQPTVILDSTESAEDAHPSGLACKPRLNDGIMFAARRPCELPAAGIVWRSKPSASQKPTR